MNNKFLNKNLTFEPILNPSLDFLVLLFNQPSKDNIDLVTQWQEKFKQVFATGYYDQKPTYNATELSISLKNQNIELTSLDKWAGYGFLCQQITHLSNVQSYNNIFLVTNLLNNENTKLFFELYKKKFVDETLKGNPYHTSSMLEVFQKNLIMNVFLGNFEKAKLCSDFYNQIINDVENYKKKGYSSYNTYNRNFINEPIPVYKIFNVYQYLVLSLTSASAHFQNTKQTYNEIKEINDGIWNLLKERSLFDGKIKHHYQISLADQKNQENNFQNTKIAQKNFYPDLIQQFFKNNEFGKNYPEITQKVFKYFGAEKSMVQYSTHAQLKYLSQVYQNTNNLSRPLQEHFYKRLENIVFKYETKDIHFVDAIMQTGKVFSEKTGDESLKMFEIGFHNWCLNKPSLYGFLEDNPQWQEFDKKIKEGKTNSLQELWNSGKAPFMQSFFSNPQAFAKLEQMNIDWTQLPLKNLLKIITPFLKHPITKRMGFLETVLTDLMNKNKDALFKTDETFPLSLADHIKNCKSPSVVTMFEALLIKNSLSLNTKKTNISKL